MFAHDHQELLDTLTAALKPRPEILEAYLFGSSARGDAQPHSDLDIAIFVEGAPGSESAFGYAAELIATLSTRLGRNDIDVVLLNQASPLLYHRILRDGVRLFSRDSRATTTREGQALSRYSDYLPQLRKIEAAHAARMKRGNFGTVGSGASEAAIVRSNLPAIDQALQTLRKHQGRPVSALRSEAP